MLYIRSFKKFRKSFIVISLYLCLLLISCGQGLSGIVEGDVDPWYNSLWPYRIKITINGSQVAEDLADFPVLVNIPENTSISEHALDNGSDILFALKDGVTALDYEIEEYDSATGRLTTWVRVPRLSSSADTVLYLYYGNPDSPVLSDPEAVWDSNYRLVQHMNQDPSGTPPQMIDSTSNGNDCVSNPAGGMIPEDSVTAIIGKGLDFEGETSLQFMDCGNDESLNITQNMTLEFWINIDILPPDATYPTILGKGGEWTNGWRLFAYPLATRLGFGYHEDITPGSYWIFTEDEDLLIDTWHHIVLSYDYDNTISRLFVDGAEIAVREEVFEISGNSDNLYIGDQNDSGKFDGMLDEIRISSTARSAAWIAASFYNQSSPEMFYTMGNEETYAEWKRGD